MSNKKVDANEVLRLYKLGHRKVEIAKMLGVTPECIYSTLSSKPKGRKKKYVFPYQQFAKNEDGMVDFNCPMCDKNFSVFWQNTSEYAYSVLFEHKRFLFCSWGCLQKHRKEYEEFKKGCN